MSRLLTGGEILCRTLLDAGVEVLFGYPGGAIMPFYDALHGHPALRHILVRNERAAAHAADGYARASNRVGVCVATSGPGATNLVTGLAAAHMDGSPVLAITGQVARPMLGRDAFQETDVVGVTMPVTKHNVLVRDVADLDRKSTRLNSSHLGISYAVFCLKKKRLYTFYDPNLLTIIGNTGDDILFHGLKTSPALNRIP